MPLSGAYYRRRAGGHDVDGPVCVCDVGHIAGMDVRHDQQEQDHREYPEQEREEEPDVDFDYPVHNKITT